MRKQRDQFKQTTREMDQNASLTKSRSGESFFGIFITTIAALTLAFGSITSLAFPDLILNGSWDGPRTAGEFITRYCPTHLVPLSWITGKTELELLAHWIRTEMQARLCIIWLFWLAGMIIFIRQTLNFKRLQ